MKLYILFFAFVFAGISAQTQPEKEALGKILDNWHHAAATANFDEYFGYMTPDARYIGTDATENWSIQEFKEFAKPYFDRGVAWNFKPLHRNIYVDSSRRIAWFDEVVSGWMKLCRGAGILELVDGQWKIKHYVLSMTVPNQNAQEVIKIKQVLEDELIKTYQK